MLPSKEEMEEFVKEIPPTALGKLEKLNKFFLKEKDLGEAFKQMALFMEDLTKNNPAYLEMLKSCRTEEEIKQKTGEFFAQNPQMVEETILSMLAIKRDKWEEAEKKKEVEEKVREKEVEKSGKKQGDSCHGSV